MKRVICLLLALMMVVMILVSCKDNGEGETTTAPDVETKPLTGNDYLFDATALKARNEAENKTMYVLCWNSEHKEFEITEDQITVDEVNASIYERDNQVKNRLGLTAISYNEQTASSGNEENFAKYVERVATNGDTEVDVIAAYSRSAGLCSQKGFYLPLNFFPNYINLSNSWYPEALIEEISLKDNIYYVSGDISTNLLFLTYGFIFNKELLEKLGIDYNEYYKMVDEGKWTLDEMYKLCTYYEDADGSGGKSDLDGYGLRSFNYHLDAFYTGSNLRLVNINNKAEKVEDLITISSDYGSSKSMDLNDALGNFFASDNAYNGTSNMCQNFASTRNTIAMVTRIRDIGKHITILEDKLPVGILPIPKYDENQEDYKCVAGNPFTLWGIFSGNMDLEREEAAAGFIEYMGYYGMENTTEAVFADTFLGRYADQPDDANVFTTIRRTTSFDIGRIFTKVISPSGAIADQWSNCASKGGNWSSIYRSFIRSYTENAKIASKDFWELKEVLQDPYIYPYQ